MILVDTSVWVHHLRHGDARLGAKLEAGDVACHPFVIGELACGQLRRRREILAWLARLPRAVVADHDEVLGFVEASGVPGSGIGWIDAHLLASSRLSRAPIWTFDRRMQAAARALDLAVD